MRTPLFQEDQKLFADKPSDLSNTEQNVLNFLRADASATGQLLAHEQTTPNMTVYVEGCNNLHVDGTNIAFIGGNSPTFTAPASSSRTDLLAITALGVLVIYQNTSGPGNYPPAVLPIAEVTISSTTTTLTDSLIKDVRQVFGPRNTFPARYVSPSVLGSAALDAPTNTIYAVGTTYIVGTAALSVYLDGVLMEKDVDYSESSTTQVTFLNRALLDTQKLIFVANDTAGYDVSGKVSKTGDTMTGNLTIPQLNFGTSSWRIYKSGNDMIFKDPNNTARTLDDLYISHLDHSEFVATSSQTVFTLPFSYTVGSNKLQVFVNGSLKRVTTHYTETNTTTVTFLSGLTVSDLVTFHHVQ